MTWNVALVLAMFALGSIARGADPTLTVPGNVRFAKTANRAFDSYTQSRPTRRSSGCKRTTRV